MKFHIITLGCPKNAVDSEGMHGILTREGHMAVDQTDAADVVIVNTCSFINAAREETLGVLNDLAQQKSPQQKLIAAGCMAESHGEVLRQRVPALDATLSTREWMRIGSIVGELGGAPAKNTNLGIPLIGGMSIPVMPANTGLNLTLTPASTGDTLGAYGDWRTTAIQRSKRGPSAYLKISDGCNLRCAFCTIPSFKGDMRSKPVGAILGEARELVESGVQEIILVAQHLTDYGRDLGMKENGLGVLLQELSHVVPRDRWIRVMYAYPQSITPALIDTMATIPQLCHYVDMPLQHAHPDTLRRMRRPPDTDKTKQIIANLRHVMPDLAIRTTFIVGYPGETRDEFRALLTFLDEMRFDRVGIFRYSLEPNTVAGDLPDQVAERVKERRWNEAMELQQAISRERTARFKGQTLKILIEGTGSDDGGNAISIGRSYRDAPEVDGMVFVRGNAHVGEFANVQITHTTDYDLWGNVVGS
ncbi:MAG: 30S ribosomal protein S12 methylthiotransferase RimO [Herpetosiphon sp.]|nr:30S ribosomal protein S12 methylthiotransferase RimO [Herpetosiphon sp.]